MTRRTLAAGRWFTLTLALFCPACGADSSSKVASAAPPVPATSPEVNAMPPQ